MTTAIMPTTNNTRPAVCPVAPARGLADAAFAPPTSAVFWPARSTGGGGRLPSMTYAQEVESYRQQANAEHAAWEARTVEAAIVRIEPRLNVRVRIADVHAALPGLSLADLHRTLLAVERTGRLTLMQLDNPREITDRDRLTVLLTPSGCPRHILYYGGRHS